MSVRALCAIDMYMQHTPEVIGVFLLHTGLEKIHQLTQVVEEDGGLDLRIELTAYFQEAAMNSRYSLNLEGLHRVALYSGFRLSNDYRLHVDKYVDDLSMAGLFEIEDEDRYR